MNLGYAEKKGEEKVGEFHPLPSLRSSFPRAPSLKLWRIATSGGESYSKSYRTYSDSSGGPAVIRR